MGLRLAIALLPLLSAEGEDPSPQPGLFSKLYAHTFGREGQLPQAQSYGLALNPGFGGQVRPVGKNPLGFEPLQSVDELADSSWTLVANDTAAYNYRTRAEIVGVGCEVLLDGGAGVNNVAEEVAVGALNVARAMGIDSKDPRYPVIQLEK